jgi:hypothetical protein
VSVFTPRYSLARDGSREQDRPLLLNQLAADLAKRGIRLVPAGEIGQVCDMLAAVSGPDGTLKYHRTAAEAVTAARTGPAAGPAKEE